jgi:tetratricopeptide (TPR) repeat protein
MDKKDLAGARQHVAAVLELAPANQAALDLKRQIDAPATTTIPPRGKPAPTTTTTTAPVSVENETPGIPRRPNEAWPDYLTRVQRIDTTLKQGKSFAEKRDFVNALARIRLVAGEQKGYQDVEALILDTLMKQRAALEQAMKYGQDSEKQSPPKWSDALKWYQNALFIDPSATAARDKIGPLTERVTKEGTDAFNRGDVLRKRGDNAKAIEAFKVAAEVLPANNEKKAEAQRWLETLKP